MSEKHLHYTSKKESVNHIKYQLDRDKLKNTLIVGLNKDSLDIYEKIINYPALGLKVCGFVIVNDSKLKFLIPNVKMLNDIHRLKEYFQRYKIEMVIISLEPSQREYLKNIIQNCEESGISYQIVSNVYDTVYGNVIKDIYKDLFHYTDFSIRRFLDIIGGIILSVIFSPIIILISVIIKIESVGPILYSQLNMGKDSKPFRIYKFRSMIEDAEKKIGPVWTQKNDPRITQFGHFLRQTRLDEIPYLINIIKGDMSFIGPKPERLFYVNLFKQQLPFYANRLKVKPGLTGWAQVKWPYEETISDIKEKLAYDMIYINNRNLIFDLKIIILSIRKAFFRGN